MNVSELARRTGISPSGVRWYEAAGVLPPASRRPNGYRTYSEDDIARLQLVVALRRLGVEPTEAGRVARLCVEHDPASTDLATILAEQRLAIGRRREELDRLEAELTDLEATFAAATGQARRHGSDLGPGGRPVEVLFVCNGNSARSQIGEALLERLGGADFEADSAGTRPRPVHPLAVRVLAEVRIDWTGARCKPVEEFAGRRFDYVITLADAARDTARNLGPAMPGAGNSLHWHLEDPAAAEGTEGERLDAFRRVREELSLRLRPFVEIAIRAARASSATA